MKRIVFLASLASALLAAASDGFISLMPRERIDEFWIAEGAPADIWSVRDGIIYCKGKPNGFLRSKKVYRSFVLRARMALRTGGLDGRTGEVAQCRVLYFRQRDQRRVADVARSAGASW